MSTEQEIKEDLCTRFIKLCEEFFWGKDIYVYTLTEFDLDRTKLEGIFNYWLDKKKLPHKLVLREAIQFSGQHPRPELRKEVGDHLEDSLGAALAKLEIEEPNKQWGVETETRDYVFRRDGDMWAIFYEGKQFPHIKNERGMSLISYVLFNRGTAFQSPFELESAIYGSPLEELNGYVLAPCSRILI